MFAHIFNIIFNQIYVSKFYNIKELDYIYCPLILLTSLSMENIFEYKSDSIQSPYCYYDKIIWPTNSIPEMFIANSPTNVKVVNNY